MVLQRLLLDLTTLLNDPGTVAPANALPSISMSIVQHVRLSDGSLVRLDMDRGVTPARHGGPTGTSTPGARWARPPTALDGAAYRRLSRYLRHDQTRNYMRQGRAFRDCPGGPLAFRMCWRVLIAG